MSEDVTPRARPPIRLVNPGMRKAAPPPKKSVPVLLPMNVVRIEISFAARFELPMRSILKAVSVLAATATAWAIGG